MRKSLSILLTAGLLAGSASLAMPGDPASAATQIGETPFHVSQTITTSGSVVDHAVSADGRVGVYITSGYLYTYYGPGKASVMLLGDAPTKVVLSAKGSYAYLMYKGATNDSRAFSRVDMSTGKITRINSAGDLAIRDIAANPFSETGRYQFLAVHSATAAEAAGSKSTTVKIYDKDLNLESERRSSHTGGNDFEVDAISFINDSNVLMAGRRHPLLNGGSTFQIARASLSMGNTGTGVKGALVPTYFTDRDKITDELDANVGQSWRMSMMGTSQTGTAVVVGSAIGRSFKVSLGGATIDSPAVYSSDLSADSSNGVMFVWHGTGYEILINTSLSSPLSGPGVERVRLDVSSPEGVLSVRSGGGTAHVMQKSSRTLFIIAPSVVPEIGDASPAPAKVGVEYEGFTIPTTGSRPMTFAVSAGTLPAGLELNETTGAVSGVPTETSAGPFTVTVSNVAGSTSAEFEIDVAGVAAAPVIGSDSPAPGVVGQKYPGFTVPVSGTPELEFVVTKGVLPAGLSLDDRTGVISGTPTVPGSQPFTVTVSNPHGSDAAEYRIAVDSATRSVDRIAGTDRFIGSVAVSKEQFDSGASVVYLATGGGFADALSAGPAAAKAGGPVLLTEPAALPAAVRAEIERLKPGKVVIVGGTSAVSATVFDQVKQLVPNTVRVGGIDRYETSRLVSQTAFTTADWVAVVTGEDFPDAVSASAVASNAGGPVVLVDGKQPSLDATTKAFIDGLKPKQIRVAGGPTIVSAGIYTALSPLASESIKRASGIDRNDTAVLLNQEHYSTATHAVLATGINYPDALYAGPFAGTNDAPMYLVQTGCVPPQVLTDLDRLGVKRVTLIGGTGVLTDAVSNLTRCP